MYQRRNHKQFQDMEQDFHDDDVNDQLDHCKLYVKNISKALNEDGLKTLFSKYGNCTRVFLSTDPNKRFALVTFETPSEARLAMMNLNNTEPLKLHINVAYKKPQQDSQNQRRSVRDYQSSNCRDEEMSNGSRGRYSRERKGSVTNDTWRPSFDMSSKYCETTSFGYRVFVTVNV